MTRPTGRGGPGRGQGRKPIHRDKPKNVTYRRPAIEPPATPEEEAALEAFNELKPPERLEVIVRWHRQAKGEVKLTKASEPGQGQERN